MGGYDYIEQSTFMNGAHKLRVNLLYTSNWLTGEIKSFIEPFGITQKQFNILRILRGRYPDEKGATIQEIREQMIDKMSDASRLVDRLYKKELIERKPCIEDKRHTRVWICEKGLKLLQQIDAKIKDLDAILDGLNEEEMAYLNQLLIKMRNKKFAKK